nr:hypothetical protein RKHAN_02776 [Rhizobium sp. Khangiran2]
MSLEPTANKLCSSVRQKIGPYASIRRHLIVLQQPIAPHFGQMGNGGVLADRLDLMLGQEGEKTSNGQRWALTVETSLKVQKHDPLCQQPLWNVRNVTHRPWRNQVQV